MVGCPGINNTGVNTTGFEGKEVIGISYSINPAERELEASGSVN
jgi:hypothetical protein